MGGASRGGARYGRPSSFRRRRSHHGIVACTALLLVVVAAGCRPSAPNAPALAAQLRAGRGADIGLANGGPNGDPTIFARELDASKATGAHWYRGDVTSVGEADYVVSMTRPRGLKVLAVLGGSSKWLNPALCSAIPAKYGPSHGGGIDAVELLNEPDLPFGAWGALSPGQYLDQVRSCVSAVRAADPAMPIVVGAVSMAAPGGPLQWFANLYAANGGGALPGDAVSWHPYLDWAGFNAPGQWTWTANLHALMALHGDGNKQVWATETGAPTSGFHSVDLGTQASIAGQIVAHWHQFGSYAGALFFYQVRDHPAAGGLAASDPASRDQNYGLLYSNFTPKPAYAAFAQAIATS
jgi:hypothetical protein